jgi:transcriptional regulator with XRE-family HTH domain
VYYNKIKGVVQMATFGDRLRSLRIEKELNQEELGKIFNMTKSRISQYETSKHEADDETKKMFADYFKVSLDYLMGRTNIREPESLTLDEELQQLLNDPDTMVAFKDFKNLSETDKQEIINFIRFKKQQNK